MRISTKGRYALRMALDIASHQQDGCVALKDVAERQQISRKYLEQIAITLSQAGLLRGTRGHQGGYLLSMEPDQLTVMDILRATECTMSPVPCLESGLSECDRCDICQALPLWNELDRLIDGYLSSVTLRDLLKQRLPRAEHIIDDALRACQEDEHI